MAEELAGVRHAGFIWGFPWWWWLALVVVGVVLFFMFK